MTREKDAKKLVAGYSAVDITPPTGEFCSFRLSPNKRSLGAHDNLYIHAVYLENDDTKLLLISTDVCTLTEQTTEQIKSAITAQTNLPASQILVAATHTHNGAELFGEEPFADISVQVARVVNGAAQAARTAIDEKFHARIGWGNVELPGVAKNRFQARLENGNVNLADDRLDFLRIEDADGNYKGIVWHFAAHPTTAMRAEYLSSADYYGAANAMTIERLGGFSVFFNGACGNINPILGERTFERASDIGQQIASELIANVPQTATQDTASLAISQTNIDVPLTAKRKTLELPDDREEILEYFQKIKQMEIAPEDYDQHWPTFQRLRTSWWKHKLIDELSDAKSQTITIQALRILDHLILTVPGEIFIELQFGLQEAFLQNRVLIFGYANGYMGYIPDPESYERAAYETSPSFAHRAGKYAGTEIITAGEKLIQTTTGIK